MDQYQADREEQGLTELIDAQLNCTHKETVFAGELNFDDRIYCTNCPMSWSEQEWTDSQDTIVIDGTAYLVNTNTEFESEIK